GHRRGRGQVRTTPQCFGESVPTDDIDRGGRSLVLRDLPGLQGEGVGGQERPLCEGGGGLRLGSRPGECHPLPAPGDSCEGGAGLPEVVGGTRPDPQKRQSDQPFAPKYRELSRLTGLSGECVVCEQIVERRRKNPGQAVVGTSWGGTALRGQREDQQVRGGFGESTRYRADLRGERHRPLTI